MALASAALRALGSFGLSVTLFLLLGLLTWLGTLEQVDHGLFEVQRKYFESFVLVHDFGPLALPLPGANLVLCVLFANLVVGGVLRLRKGWATAGILITHLGILLMLFAGFVKMYHSADGHVTLFEGESSGEFQSYYRWELAVLEDLGEGSVREHIAPGAHFVRAAPGAPARLTSPELPFELVVERFLPNCRPDLKGPMFEVDVPVVDGVFLRELARDREAEANIAGAYLRVREPGAPADRAGIVFGAGRIPWAFRAGGRAFAVELRKERYPMPFTLRLDDFTKEDHPRLNLPKAFESDVTLFEGGTSREVKISMNEPLRQGGLVVYQASWGPSNARPGDRLFSTLAVVRNPADQLPLVSCIIIAIGMLIHFSRKLVRHVRIASAPAGGTP